MADTLLDSMRVFENALDVAAKAGDINAAREISAKMGEYMQANSRVPADKVLTSQERMPGDIRSQVPQPYYEQLLAGAGTAPVRAYQGLIGAFGGQVNPTDIQSNEGLKSATPLTQLGNVAGNVMMFGGMPARLGGQVIAPALRAGSRVLGSAAEATGASSLANALRTFGNVAPTTTRLGSGIDATLTGGATSAAIEPGGWEDRAKAAAFGTGASAIPSLAVGGGQGLRRKLTSAGQDIGIAERIGADLGSNAENIIQQLRSGSYPARSYGVSPSAAMETGNPQLGAWELGSRVRQGDRWVGIDKANAAARFEALNNRGDSEIIKMLRDARNTETSGLRNQAMSDANTSVQLSNSNGISNKEFSAIQRKIDDIRTGPDKPNPAAQEMANWLESNIQNATPEQLYTVRKLMTEDIPKGPADKLGAALKGARVQRIELVGMIDDVLNKVSGGKFGEYMTKYREMSPEISSRSAVAKIVDTLRGGAAPGVVPETMGHSGGAGFRTVERLTKQHGEKEMGATKFDQLLPEDRQLLDTVASDLRSQSANQKGGAIIGSSTAPNAAAAARGGSAVSAIARQLLSAGGGIPGRIASGRIEKTLAGIEQSTDEQLAQLLQNPQLLADALRKSIAGKQLLRQSQQLGSGAAQSGRQLLITPADRQ